MILKKSPVLDTDQLLHFLEICREIIQDTRKEFSVLGLTIKFVKHEIWIVDGRDRLVGASVG